MSRNLLDQETSPYLLLHKDNPVHWRPWGPDALAEAETSGKPILLSVGYTACHWCHVMNHESFADPQTAALMNELFVNIKVDREERPDIDQIYQAAANVLGHSGGWPLTMFLNAKGEPFFAAAYLPNEERFGQPAFKTVLTRCSEIYKDQPDAVTNTNARVQDAYNKLWNRDLSGVFDAVTFDSIAIHVGQRFDTFYGGLTGAPKFPTTGLVELLWRGYLRSSVPQFQQLVQTTLDYMSMSGIYDHVGGGYARYAMDETWFVPHFEKMLYDNALMIDILTLVWQSDRLALYRDRIEETVTWVLREMMVEHGFASSIDADSEGEEGKYYLWTEAEIDAALMGTYVQKFKDTYNVRREGNYQNGRNILHRIGPQSGYAIPEADAALLKRQRDLLLAARKQRTAPMRDDKVLADWNGMMIAALANAGAVFKKLEWTAAAIRAFEFVVKVLGDGDRLYHSWREGKRQHTGFVDDYAHMARAAIALWEATGDKNYLSYAQRWVHVLNEHFWDVQNGGYFYTADDSDPLIVRSRMVFDQAMPCANGTMVTVLGKLFHATADNAYRDRTNALIQAFAGEINRAYISMGSYLNGIEFILAGVQIVIVGPIANAKTHQLADAVLGRSLPNKVVMLVDPKETLPEGHPAFGKTMENGQPTAYLCQRNICSQPITNPVQLSQILLLPARVAQQQQMQAQQQAAMQPAGRA
ncbi:MAG: thioredoxin domain-containing protein [Proteobacteria bacterium]|nr:thioredoxin domain-containing protein [Pseudomonadota bacterium]